MLKNYLKIAWRSLWKQKFFSLINIISLSIGLSASLVIGMMVYHDFSFDKFHENGDHIYRAVSDLEFGDDAFGNPGTPIPLGETMLAEYPEVEKKAHFVLYNPAKITAPSTQKTSRINDRVVFAEDSYFSIFDYEWLAGNPETALSTPNNVVLTQQRAAYYFPNLTAEEIIGQTLDYKEFQANISGIVANFKNNSDLIFLEFIAYDTITQSDLKGMSEQGFDSINSSSQLYVQLRPDADVASINKRLASLAESQWDEDSIEFGMKSWYKLQPLSDIHFNTKYGIYDYSRNQANKTVLTSLGFVALFLLLLGVVNFINLNTASATQRAREIGVRKTLGSSRSQLIRQFLGETFLLTMFSMILSIGLSYWMIQVFSDYIVEAISLSLLLKPVILIGMLVLLLIVTLAAGFYPSLVLSSFKPSKVLKGEYSSASGNPTIRKGLTVFQFGVAQVFIIGSLLVGRQIHFALNQDMGFEKENRLFVQMPWGEKDFSKKAAFQIELNKIPGVEMTSLGSMPPASISTHVNMMKINHNGQQYKTEVRMQYGDTEYLKLYNIDLLAGRIPLNDTIAEFVLNEKATKTLGFKSPEEIINQQVTYDDKKIAVVGVMKDFHQASAKNEIMPLAFTGDLSRSAWGYFSTVHLKTAANTDISQVIEKIKSTYLSVFPDNEVNVGFLDESIEQFYREDQRLSKLLNWATGLSILISCLGLLGLVIHTIERRRKEIGIRKVLGATVTQINTLLCKEFVLLIGIAFVIAAPIAYYFIQDYLNDFVFRTDISIWIFLGSIAAMTLIALAVMSIKTISTAMRNPVESLKTE